MLFRSESHMAQYVVSALNWKTGQIEICDEIATYSEALAFLTTLKESLDSSAYTLILRVGGV